MSRLNDCIRITGAIFSAESGCVPPVMSRDELEEDNFGPEIEGRWDEIYEVVSKIPDDIQAVLVKLTNAAVREMPHDGDNMQIFKLPREG